MEDATTDGGNQSVIVTLNEVPGYTLGDASDTVTIVDGKVADIFGNGTVTAESVFLISQYLLQEDSLNLDTLLQTTFGLFSIDGATNDTGSELSAAIQAQISLFDIDGNGNTSVGDVFLINQFLLQEGSGNRDAILEQVANAFGNDLNGPNQAGSELSAALSNLLGS